MADEKYDYAVRNAGYFYGAYRTPFERIRLTARQAKYEIMAGNLFERGKEPIADQGHAPASSTSVAEVATKPSRKPRRISEST